ncbi:hypothetical protein VTN02DRAFT_3927 [Thermoascus thermophilus]
MQRTATPPTLRPGDERSAETATGDVCAAIPNDRRIARRGPGFSPDASEARHARPLHREDELNAADIITVDWTRRAD